MFLKVKVKAHAKEEGVFKQEGGFLIVKVKAPREKGLANCALLKTLSTKFKIPLSAISIKSGSTSLKKIINIDPAYAQCVFEVLSSLS